MLVRRKARQVLHTEGREHRAAQRKLYFPIFQLSTRFTQIVRLRTDHSCRGRLQAPVTVSFGRESELVLLTTVVTSGLARTFKRKELATSDSHGGRAKEWVCVHQKG